MIRLLDDQLKVRAVLSTTKDGPAISMCDPNEKPRAQLTYSGDNPRLVLIDGDAKATINLSIPKILGPKIEITDENGNKVFSKP